MKIIKLTSAINGIAVYVNVSHLTAFWEYGGVTIITTTNEDGIGRVKETPEEIVKLIEFAWKV